MSSKKDPFVTEVMRIIRREFYRVPKRDRKTVILVSQRFHHAAIKNIRRVNQTLGIDFIRDDDKSECFTFKGLLLAPAPWLTDYEFEFRLPLRRTQT